MTATSVVCPECGSPVAPGRLSCQSCGTLLASVVGSSRRQPWAATPATLPEIDEDVPIASARLTGPQRMPEPMPDPLPEAMPEPAVADPAPSPAPKRGPRRLARTKAPAATDAPDKARYVKAGASEPAPSIDQAALFGPVPTVAPPILHDWSDGTPPTNGAARVDQVPAPTYAPDPMQTPAPTYAPAPTAIAATAGAATAPRVAGSYLAPSATYAAPLAAYAAPRPTPWQAGSRALPPSPQPSGNGNSVAVARGAVAAPVAEAEAVGFRRLTDWLTIGGSILVIVSFFLPWATDGVIGSRGSGFTADWGLANPGHLLLIVAAAIVLLLHALENPIPVWFRSGVLPLLVGGILAGLAFAYYARPAGGGAGVAVLLAGALVLIGGGLLACRPERHGTSASRV